MRGYKVLLKGLINRYGFQYEVGKTYQLNGNLKWRENGFHFCMRPEDTLRYIDGFNDEIEMVEVEGSKDLALYEDEYYGFYDMYATSEMTIIRVVPREEFFQMVMDSHDEDRVKRLASLLKLSQNEKDVIRLSYPRVQNTLDYYQSDEYILKRKHE